MKSMVGIISASRCSYPMVNAGFSALQQSSCPEQTAYRQTGCPVLRPRGCVTGTGGQPQASVSMTGAMRLVPRGSIRKTTWSGDLHPRHFRKSLLVMRWYLSRIRWCGGLIIHLRWSDTTYCSFISLLFYLFQASIFIIFKKCSRNTLRVCESSIM